jgi:hypothetical protein
MDTDSIAGLLFSCPFENSLDKCVFNEIRNKSIPDRIAVFLRMDAETKESYLNAHKLCLKLREAKQSTESKNFS